MNQPKLSKLDHNNKEEVDYIWSDRLHLGANEDTFKEYLKRFGPINNIWLDKNVKIGAIAKYVVIKAP